jgi:hypothetical protein
MLKALHGYGAGLPDGTYTFKPKNHNLDKFWRALEWKMLAYFMGIGNRFRPSGMFYGH